LKSVEYFINLYKSLGEKEFLSSLLYAGFRARAWMYFNTNSLQITPDPKGLFTFCKVIFLMSHIGINPTHWRYPYFLPINIFVYSSAESRVALSVCGIQSWKSYSLEKYFERTDIPVPRSLASIIVAPKKEFTLATTKA